MDIQNEVFGEQSLHLNLVGDQSGQQENGLPRLPLLPPISSSLNPQNAPPPLIWSPWMTSPGTYLPPPPPTGNDDLDTKFGRHPSSTVYSFVPIPGAQQHKRPRRRYEEIERMYKCGWNGCEKAYSTLNYLNPHVTIQSHDAKRTPDTFRALPFPVKAQSQPRRYGDSAAGKAVASHGKNAEGKYECPHCNKTYLHLRHLKRHLLRHDTDEDGKRYIAVLERTHLQEPADSNADLGTYTCTYHGCTLRFDTPQKLQKHKRERHRNAAKIGSPRIGDYMWREKQKPFHSSRDENSATLPSESDRILLLSSLLGRSSMASEELEKLRHLYHGTSQDALLEHIQRLQDDVISTLSQYLGLAGDLAPLLKAGPLSLHPLGNPTQTESNRVGLIGELVHKLAESLSENLGKYLRSSIKLLDLLSNRAVFTGTLLCLLNRVHALEDSNGAAAEGCWNHLLQHILFVALLGKVSYDTVGTRCLPLIMGGLSVTWPIIKTDPRSTTAILYSVYSADLIVTAAYGYAAFREHEDPRVPLLQSVLLSAAMSLIILFCSQDGMQSVLTFFPVVASLSTFMVANYGVLEAWIGGCLTALRQLVRDSSENCFHYLGSCLENLGQRWQRRSPVDDDLERQNMIMPEASSVSPDPHSRSCSA